MSWYNTYSHPIYRFTNTFFPWVAAYQWFILLFGLWNLALVSPKFSKLKFFNWPFETRADYIEPKKWIPPRER